MNRSKYNELPHKEQVGGCAVGVVASVDGKFSSAITHVGWDGLERMKHRGGVLKVQEEDGSWSDEADGSGIQMNFDRSFVKPDLDGKTIPENEKPLILTSFLPRGSRDGVRALADCRNDIHYAIETAGLSYITDRRVVTDPSVLGRGPRESAPEVFQTVIGYGKHQDEAAAERALWSVDQILRRRWDLLTSRSCQFPQVVSYGQTVTYKALATPAQLRGFYPQASANPHPASIAQIHVRHATNAGETWGNVQPVRKRAANGEINSIAANRAAVSMLEDDDYDSKRFLKILTGGASDTRDASAYLDYLIQVEGLPLEEAMRRMMPPAWWVRQDVTPQIADWFLQNRLHLGALSEWEGPNFSIDIDGTKIGLLKDRMGYRPPVGARVTPTEEAGVVFEAASETGGFDLRPLKPSGPSCTLQLSAGDAMLVDTVEHKVLTPAELHQRISARDVLGRSRGRVPIRRLSTAPEGIDLKQFTDSKLLVLSGWTTYERDYVDAWLKGKKEPRGSMGRYFALACLSKYNRPLTEYAYPMTATNTNPANEPEIEADKIDTTHSLGNGMHGPFFGELTAFSPREITALQNNVVIDTTLSFPNGEILHDKKEGSVLMKEKINAIAEQAVAAVKHNEVSIITLTHESVDGTVHFPLPMCLVVAAVRKALRREKLHASIVANGLDIRDRRDMLVNFQCGADSVCPLGIFARAQELGISEQDVLKKLNLALRKAMSLVGVTTVQGYREAKLFEFVGVGKELIEDFFPGIPSRVGGIDMEDLYEDLFCRNKRAQESRGLPVWREISRIPTKVSRVLIRDKLARTGDFVVYEEVERVMRAPGPLCLSDLWEVLPIGPPIPVEEVISEVEILAKYCRGAHISRGALGKPAHYTIAGFWNYIARLYKDMTGNECPAASGSGEGGEEIWERCAGGVFEDFMNRDRQFAAGRYMGVAAFLADPLVKRITLKIQQGAKPDESANVPAKKNDPNVARLRGADPWTRLRSLVNNADLFSIESFSEVVGALKELNPSAKISVKYASGSSMGVISIGVAKSGCHEVLISGGEGGTGSATIQAITTTGHPRELGFSDTHMRFDEYGLERDVKIIGDGGMFLSHDFFTSLAQGLHGVAFGTLAMFANGCGKLDKCHIGGPDGCDFGVATQDAKLLENYLIIGLPEDEKRRIRSLNARELYLLGIQRMWNVFVNGFAHQVRLECARRGVRDPGEYIGRTDKLRQRKTGNPRLDKLDLSGLTNRKFTPGKLQGRIRRRVERVNNCRINEQMLQDVDAKLNNGAVETIELHYVAENCDQDIGTRLSGEIIRNPEKYQGKRFVMHVSGKAGFGCFMFLAPGQKGVLDGDTNNNFGASMMEGAMIVAKPPKGQEHLPSQQTAGETALYGSSGGEAYLRFKMAGVRFGACLRKGVRAVCEIEEVGENPFQAMSSGSIVWIGGSLRKSPFAGMTGGTVYVFDDPELEKGIYHNSVKVIRSLTPVQENEIRTLLANHVRETKSPHAEAILTHWEAMKDRWAVVTADEATAQSEDGVDFHVSLNTMVEDIARAGRKEGPLTILA